MSDDELTLLAEADRRAADYLRSVATRRVFSVLNQVVLNQVVVRGRSDAETNAIRLAVDQSGEAWFGPTTWDRHAAFRISTSSWRTQEADIERLVAQLRRLLAAHDAHSAVEKTVAGRRLDHDGR
jgi:glutamate/tyrosine decarboxylase-like PLP-dependent enzyme